MANPETPIIKYAVLEEQRGDYDADLFGNRTSVASIVAIHEDLTLSEYLGSYIRVDKAQAICTALNALLLQ